MGMSAELTGKFGAINTGLQTIHDVLSKTHPVKDGEETFIDVVLSKEEKILIIEKLKSEIRLRENIIDIISYHIDEELRCEVSW